MNIHQNAFGFSVSSDDADVTFRVAIEDLDVVRWKVLITTHEHMFSMGGELILVTGWHNDVVSSVVNFAEQHLPRGHEGVLGKVVHLIGEVG